MAMNIPSSSSRNCVLVALFSGLFLCSACNGEEQKRQLAELQKKCDDRVSQLDRQSKEQVGGLEKQLDALKLEAAESAAKAKSEVDEAVAKAQASVDDAEKEATAALKKARDAYRAEAKSRYATLNKDLADVTAKAQKIPAKGKAAYDKAIQGVLDLQKEITKDMAAYDKATLDTLGKTKSKVDVDLAKYKTAIKTARSKVPA